MMKFTDKNSVIRMIAAAITTINMVICAFGGEAIAISDNTIYLIGSTVATIVAVGIAVYKNNSTSAFGKLCKTIKSYVNTHGIEEVFETVINALQENFAEEDEYEESE